MMHRSISTTFAHGFQNEVCGLFFLSIAHETINFLNHRRNDKIFISCGEVR